MTRILLVEQDTERKRMISDGLAGHGFTVRDVSTGVDAIVSQRSADVVVLNLDLPDLEGTEVCRRIRAASNVALIGMIENSTAQERVLALRSGLDACMATSSRTVELIARIEAMMRRRRQRVRSSTVISHGELEIDGAAREVRLSGSRVSLTTKEFELLYLLASRQGVTIDRSEILAAVWNDDNAWMLRSRTMDTHVNSIRRKIGTSAVIQTVRGVGFRFCWPDTVS